MLWQPNTFLRQTRGTLYAGGVVAAQHARFCRGCLLWILLVASGWSMPSSSEEQATSEPASYEARDSVAVDARTYAGWRAVRQFDCARCHGAQYQGRIGPSLIEAARVNTRARFVQLLLEGNRERGMPPYRDVHGIADNADGIYGYFRGRADGNIAPGVLRLLP
jgi:mono/diheme cytochrome c family protein